MFGLRLQFHQWRTTSKSWLLSLLSEDKTFFKGVYHGILDEFLYNEANTYKLYLRNAPLNEDDMERLYQINRNEFTRVNEVDLHMIWDILIEYIQFRLMWYPNVKMMIHNEISIKYIEIHYKNYKQKIE